MAGSLAPLRDLRHFVAGSFGRPCYYDETAVREAFVWALERIERFMEKKRARDPEAIDKLAEELAQRVKTVRPGALALRRPRAPDQSARPRCGPGPPRAIECPRHAGHDDISTTRASSMRTSWLTAMRFSGWPVEDLRKDFIEFEAANGARCSRRG